MATQLSQLEATIAPLAIGQAINRQRVALQSGLAKSGAWSRESPPLSLNAGVNEVNIGGREDGIKIKRIRLVEVEHLLPYPELRPDTVCDSSGDCWYLAPDGDTRCESTNGQAVGSDQCEAAVSALAMSTGTEPNSGIKKCIVPGDKCNSGWNHAPDGCSAQRAGLRTIMSLTADIMLLATDTAWCALARRHQLMLSDGSSR